MDHRKGENQSTDLIHQMICVMRNHRRWIEQATAQMGLHRSQFIMLIKISEFSKPPSQKQVADSLEITAAAAAISLNKLEKDGYIRRQPRSDDGRIKYIELSEKGREVISCSRLAFTEIDQKCFAGFSNGELHQLDEYLSRIRCNLINAQKENMPR